MVNSECTHRYRPGDRDVRLRGLAGPGPADRSYGVQVARLAGMPNPVLRQARAALEALEAHKAGGEAQVDLFAPPPAAAEPEPEHPAVQALQALDVDACSPREALEQLYRLKGLAR